MAEWIVARAPYIQSTASVQQLLASALQLGYKGSMATLLVFFMTSAELLAVALGYFLPMPRLFDALVVYGSPLYFVMNLLGSNSVAFEQQLFFPLLALFHIIKYVALCRSQFAVDRHSLHYLAVIFEVAYLVICAQQVL